MRADEIAESLRPIRVEMMTAYEREEETRRIAERERAAIISAMTRPDLVRAYHAGELTESESRAIRPVLLKATGAVVDGCRVTGGTLQTSQGAAVPLAHAFRVFQLLAYCRANGISWQAERGASDIRHRLPRTVRVGHFQLDRVDSTGDFIAGCHAIKWDDVAALADSLGVSGCLISDPVELEGERV
jgi:hypothetical protein